MLSNRAPCGRRIAMNLMLQPEVPLREGREVPAHPPSLLEEALGMTQSEFDARVRGQAVAIGRSLRITEASPLSWPDLNEILSTAGRRVGSMRVVKEGQTLDRAKYTRNRPGFEAGQIVAPALSRALIDGYSIVLNGLESHHPAALEIAGNLSRTLGEHVWVNAYVSWKSDKCFVTHWDDHDVLILQTEGEKAWSVFRPTREAPLKADVTTESARDKRATEHLEPAWEGVLRTGDVLYIPRGWWHHAKSTGRGSMHLTCGFTNRTALDLLKFLADEACHDALFRRDLGREVGGVTDPSLRDLLNAFGRALSFGDADDILSRYWRMHYSRLPLRHSHALPYSLDAELFASSDPVLCLSSAAPDLCIEDHGGAIELSAGLHKWEFVGRARPMLELILGGHPVSLSDLRHNPPGDLTSDEVTTFAFELLNEGLCYIRANGVDGGAAQ